MLEKLVHPELSYRVNGLCFQVHNELGRFAREKQYADRLEQLLVASNIKYKREAREPFRFKESQVGGNIIDFLVEDKIVLECKAKRFITRQDYYQVQRYLSATNKELGIVVNFSERYLRPRRVLNYLYHL